MLVVNLFVNAGDARDMGLIPGSERSPGVDMTATPVFLPGKFHGQRNVVGCSPWGHKESDMIERLGTHTITLYINTVLYNSF